MPEKSEKLGRGRPAHKPNPRTRRDVSIAAGGGMPHEEIALALGVSVPTLRKHLAAELSTGAGCQVSSAAAYLELLAAQPSDTNGELLQLVRQLVELALARAPGMDPEFLRSFLPPELPLLQK